MPTYKNNSTGNHIMIDVNGNQRSVNPGEWKGKLKGKLKEKIKWEAKRRK